MKYERADYQVRSNEPVADNCAPDDGPGWYGNQLWLWRSSPYGRKMKMVFEDTTETQATTDETTTT